MAMGSGIGDRTSARHIIYYALNICIATKDHAFYQKSKSSIPFIHEINDQLRTSGPVASKIVHALSLNVCHNVKTTQEIESFDSVQLQDEKSIYVENGAASIIIDVPANIKETSYYHRQMN